MDPIIQSLIASQTEMMKTIQSIQQTVSQLQQQQSSSSSSPSQLQQNSSSSPPSKSRRSRRGVSPPPSPPPSSPALLNTSIITEATTGDIDGNISPDYRNPNPRSFTHSIKQKCWEKAEKIKGRDPERWRRDPHGNTIFRKLVGCPGCLCHEYDHIVPYPQGGMSTLENCQVLQTTVNRSKGNKTDISEADLKQKSSYCWVSGRDMDLLELSAYGNVRRGQDPGGGCKIL